MNIGTYVYSILVVVLLPAVPVRLYKPTVHSGTPQLHLLRGHSFNQPHAFSHIPSVTNNSTTGIS